MNIQCPYLLGFLSCAGALLKVVIAVADALVSLPTLPRPDTEIGEGYTQNKFTAYSQIQLNYFLLLQKEPEPV